jgi:hypothetical protein
MSSINPNPQYPQSGNLTSINFRPMDVNSPNQFQPPSSVFSVQNTIIFTLCILLLLTFLGINLLDILSNLIKYIANIFNPIVSRFLSMIGYTTGTVLNSSADVVSDTSKLAIDIAEGSIQDIGNLLIKASKQGGNTSKLNTSLSIPDVANVPKQDIPENPIQKPISSVKQNWCLVGEFDNQRKCVQINEYNKCMSGKVFDNENSCLKI